MDCQIVEEEENEKNTKGKKKQNLASEVHEGSGTLGKGEKSGEETKNNPLDASRSGKSMKEGAPSSRKGSNEGLDQPTDSSKLAEAKKDEVIEDLGDAQPAVEGSNLDAKEGQNSQLNPSLHNQSEITGTNKETENNSKKAAENDLKDLEAQMIDMEEVQRLEEEKRMRSEVDLQLLAVYPDIKNLKRWHVGAVSLEYELCLHPDPVFKKHCLLTKNGRVKYDVPITKYAPYEDKPDKRMRISDFSKIKKLIVNDWSRRVRDEELSSLQNTTLNSRFLDYCKLFSLTDLQIFCDLMDQLDCFVFYRILPHNAREFKQFSAQVVHIVRKKDLIEEMNACAGGQVAFSSLELDQQLINLEDMISDEEIEIIQKERQEKLEKREAKIKRIEEKRFRREEKERIQREKLEAEQKAAEEQAALEREAARNPAKAAALRLEREKAKRAEEEAAEAKKKAQEEEEAKKKEEEEAAAAAKTEDKPFDLNDPIDPSNPLAEGFTGNEGNQNPDNIEQLDPNLLDSEIPPIEPEPVKFENQHKKNFYTISRRLINCRKLGYYSQGLQETAR